MVKITTDDLLSDLEEVAEQVGGTPSKPDYEKHGNYGTTTIERRFGTWNEAVAAVGFVPNSSRQPVTNEELVSDLKRVAEQVGGTPRRQDYEKHGNYGVSTIERRFGTWNEAVAAIGFEPNTAGTIISNEELIADLRRVASELDRTPFSAEYDERGKYHSDAIRDNIGWNNALRELGLEVNLRTDITDQELLTDVRRVATEIGSTPTRSDYEHRGDYGSMTVIERFGTWNNAVEAAGFEPNAYRNIPERKLLEMIADVSDDMVIPKVSVFEQQAVHSVETIRTTFGSYWAGCVRAGCRPHQRRPLSPAQFSQVYDAAQSLDIAKRATVLPFMFTGLPMELLANLSEDWLQDKRKRCIIRVPVDYTKSSKPWIFAVPEETPDPHTGEILQTGLPELIEWLFEFYETVREAKGKTRTWCREAAYTADLDDRERREYDTAPRTIDDEIPVVRPTDLTMTHGVNLARRNVDRETIKRRLGIEEWDRPIKVDDLFLWLYQFEGVTHSDYEPPDTVLDPC
jgi:hypothetical protein